MADGVGGDDFILIPRCTRGIGGCSCIHPQPWRRPCSHRKWQPSRRGPSADNESDDGDIDKWAEELRTEGELFLTSASRSLPALALILGPPKKRKFQENF